jgi:hypothetical protein
MQLPIALVWDSDPSIREGIEGALKQAGYATVLHASSPRYSRRPAARRVSLLLPGRRPRVDPYEAGSTPPARWPGAARP